MVLMGKLIPKYAVALVIVLILTGAFVPLVFLPYTQQAPILRQEHIDDTAQIQEYEQKLAQIEAYRQRVIDLEEQWESMMEDISIIGENTVNDFNDMFNSLNVVPQAMTLSGETETTLTSATNNKIYYVTATVTLTQTLDELLEIIEYFEDTSKGAYFIETINLAAATPSAVEEISQYDMSVNMTISLYYFKAGEPTQPPTEA